MQFIKFVIIGGCSTALNYASFSLLYRLVHWPYLLASAIGYSVGVMFGYFWNRWWTFSHHQVSRPSLRELMSYWAVYLTSLVISLGLLRWQVQGFQINPLIANASVIVVSVILNFFGLRYLVFRRRPT